MRYIILLLLMIWSMPATAFAGIDLPWETTYNCTEWDGDGYIEPVCIDSGVQLHLDQSAAGYYEQITSAANNPSGGGYRGQRHWFYTGTNKNSGNLQVIFNTNQTEIWMRFYKKFDPTWTTFGEMKSLYIWPTSGDGTVFQFYYSGSQVRLYTGLSYFSDGGYSEVASGSWNSYEIHLNVTQGVYQYWLNGVLEADFTGVDYGDLTSINSIKIGSNCKDVVGGYRYVDYDDISISNTGYIGPVDDTPIDGLCGDESAQVDTREYNCTTGSVSNTSDNVDTTTWDCAGSGGGTTDNCSAAYSETPGEPTSITVYGNYIMSNGNFISPN